MSSKIRDWRIGLAVLAFAGAGVATACGGDGTMDGDGSAGETGSGGKGTGGSKNGSGGKDAVGGSGNDTGSGGSAGDPGTGGSDPGTGGTNGGDATIGDLISAICEWEFSCCNDGERTFRLGAEGESVEDCVDYFTFQLTESNVTTNPFPPGTATGLLGTLGFTVNLDRVTENPEGIAACIDEWKDMDCAMKADPTPSCGGTVYPGDGACELVNLFDPALEIGDRCTLSLAEGYTNDIECPAGSTCLPAADPDNPEDFPACVQRSTEGQPCTADDDCDYNFYCDDGGDCTEKGDAGDDCTFQDEADPMPGEEDAACKSGLKCNPDSLTCVANCDEEYPCTVNAECPEGQACVPVTVDDDAANWKFCRDLGTSAVSRCDEDADCASNRYCDGNVCVADEDIGDDCSRNEMCEAGSFCDLSIYDTDAGSRTPTETCVAYFQPTDSCFPLASSQGAGIVSGCEGSSSCLLNVLYDAYDAVTGYDFQCATTQRDVGGDCYPAGALGLTGEPTDCKPGLICEASTTDSWPYKCTEPAGLGDDCDEDWQDEEFFSCGAGLTCKDAECVAQLDPGEDCEDVDNPGYPDAAICKNGACVENWDENGVEFICSDAAIPESNGGDDLTCGGN